MVKVVVNAGTDQSEGTGSVTVPVNSASGFFSLGSYSQYRQTKGNKLLEAYANFNNGEKKSKHLVDVTLGYSYQDWYTASPNNATYSLGNPDSVIQVAEANPFYTKNALRYPLGSIPIGICCVDYHQRRIHERHQRIEPFENPRGLWSNRPARRNR